MCTNVIYIFYNLVLFNLLFAFLFDFFINIPQIGMLCSEFWLLITHWLFDYWLLITDYWLLITHWLFDYWLLIADYWLLIIDYWLLIIDCWCMIDYWFLITDYWLMMSRKRKALLLASSQHQSIISKAFIYTTTQVLH